MSDTPLILQIDLLEESFETIQDYGDEIITALYIDFFKDADIKQLFNEINLKSQRKHLWDTLAIAIKNMRKPRIFYNFLKALGARHKNYGANPEKYGVLINILLEKMRQFGGDSWSDEIENAWRKALITISEIMLKAQNEA